MKELEILPNYPIKLEQKYAQRKHFVNFLKKIILNNELYIEYKDKESNEIKNYSILEEIEKGNFIFKPYRQGSSFIVLKGINDYYERVLNSSEKSMNYNSHTNTKINNIKKVVDIYKNYSSLIKSAKNVSKDDIRYFDFYECKNAEEVYDGFERIKALNDTKKFANKYLRSYKDLMYTKNNNNETIIDESVLRLFEVLEKQYKDGDLSSDEIKKDIRKIKGFDKNNLKETLKKIASKNNLTAEKVINKIQEENIDAEIISNSDNRLYIKINDFSASEKLGSGQWCISTDDGYYEDYLMEDDTQFKGQHIFCYDFSKHPEDSLSLFAFTINAKGKVSAAHDKNDEGIMDNIIGIINNNNNEKDQGKLLEIVKKTITPPDQQYRENKEYLNDESVNYDDYAENICYPLVFFNEANRSCHHLPALTANVIEETLRDHKKLNIYSDDYMIENLLGVAIHLKTQSYNKPDAAEIVNAYFLFYGKKYYNVNNVLKEDLEIEDLEIEELEHIYAFLGYEKQKYKLEDFFINTFNVSEVFNNASLHYRERFSNYIFENYRQDLEKSLEKEMINHRFSYNAEKIKTIMKDTVASNIAFKYYNKYKNEMPRSVKEIVVNTITKNSDFNEDILNDFININIKEKDSFNLTTTIDFIKDIESKESREYLIQNIPAEDFNHLIRPDTIMNIVNDDVLLKSLSIKQKQNIKKSTDINCKSLSSGWSISSDTGNPNKENVFDLHERVKKIYDNGLMSLESIKNSLDQFRITYGDKPRLEETLKTIEEQEKISKDVKNTLNKIKTTNKGLKNT